MKREKTVEARRLRYKGNQTTRFFFHKSSHPTPCFIYNNIP